ncbi:MAG: DUF1517 domain-containing protein [Acidobacteriota bacterium]
MTLGVVYLAFVYIRWRTNGPRRRAEQPDEAPSADRSPGELGELCVLRLALDASARELVERASAQTGGLAARLRATAKLLLEEQSTWRAGGTSDPDIRQLAELERALVDVEFSERERLARLAGARDEAEQAPFRSPVVLDGELVLVAIFVIARRSRDRPMVFEPERGDRGAPRVQAVLETLAVLRDHEVTAAEVLVHPGPGGTLRGAELASVFEPEDLIQLAP